MLTGCVDRGVVCVDGFCVLTDVVCVDMGVQATSVWMGIVLCGFAILCDGLCCVVLKGAREGLMEEGKEGWGGGGGG